MHGQILLFSSYLSLSAGFTVNIINRVLALSQLNKREKEEKG